MSKETTPSLYMPRSRKVRILATLGPASDSQAMIRRLAEAGADAFRINMSHGSHADHAKRIAAIRALEAELQRPTTILADLQGPKLRVGRFAGDKAELKTGQAFSFERAVHAWRKDMEAQFRYAESHGIHACSYEALLTDGRGVARGVLDYLALPYDEALLTHLLDRSSFRYYTGRDPGQENRKRFYRKGIAGDWKNHFRDEDKRIFKEIAGDLLIQLGYEKDLDW